MRDKGLLWAQGLLLAGAVLGAGCRKANADVPLSKQVKPGAIPANVPVPPENGPKLFAVKAGALVVEKPGSGATVIGELLVGSSVSRSEEPFAHEGCAKGYY